MSKLIVVLFIFNILLLFHFANATIFATLDINQDGTIAGVGTLTDNGELNVLVRTSDFSFEEGGQKIAVVGESGVVIANAFSAADNSPVVLLFDTKSGSVTPAFQHSGFYGFGGVYYDSKTNCAYVAGTHWPTTIYNRPAIIQKYCLDTGVATQVYLDYDYGFSTGSTIDVVNRRLILSMDGNHTRPFGFFGIFDIDTNVMSNVTFNYNIPNLYAYCSLEYDPVKQLVYAVHQLHNETGPTVIISLDFNNQVVVDYKEIPNLGYCFTAGTSFNSQMSYLYLRTTPSFDVESMNTINLVNSEVTKLPLVGSGNFMYDYIWSDSNDVFTKK